MTVCLAALCEGNTIIGASDRMMTAGDTQFEPEQSKLWVLTTSIVALVSGDAALQTEILQDVEAVVRARVEERPDEWWNVRDVAGLYVYFYNIARRKRSEAAILSPLGLSHEMLIEKQKIMAPQALEQIMSDLKYFSLRCGSVILAGVDITGAHLYSSTEADMKCFDSIGFAAIGSGRSHANSQFMFRKHFRKRAFPETLFLAYSAKKRAEIAPGVGTATDMFMIGPALGSHTYVHPKHLIELEQAYQASYRREAQARRQSEESVKKYVNQITAEATQKGQKKAEQPEEDVN